MSDTVLLISDDENFFHIIKEKLLFLRKDDRFVFSDFKNFRNDLVLADIVLVHDDFARKICLDTVQNIRRNSDKIIILLSNLCDKEFILQAYDCGINDYLSSSVEDFELVIKTVNSIKTNALKQKLLRNQKILTQLGVIDELTGLYAYKYAKQVVENEIESNLLDKGSFLIVAPTETGKIDFSIEKLGQALTNSTRSNDILTLGKGAKVYVLLPNTDCNGALVVLNKIKESYGHELAAGISEITRKSFSELENDCLKALSDALATNAEYVIAEEKFETLDDWLDDTTDDQKSYKIYKQIFNKKLEKVITPAFYRLQKTWEEKLFDTQIEQSVSENGCIFHLKNKYHESTLRIVYPGFAKIVITISHEGLDSPENKEISLALTKITTKELINIVEDFIYDFKYS